MSVTGLVPMKLKGFLYHIVSFAVPLLTAALLCAVRAEAKSAMSRQDRQMKVVAIEAGAPGTDDGDRQPPATEKDGEDNYMQYIVSGKDTMYLDQLPAAKVYERLPRQKGREWRKYYRLVHNFSKVYPYALVARKLVAEVDSTIEADHLKRGKREKYISQMQKELFNVFEKPMRSLTVSQGAMLMRLIDREVGKSSYNIIRDYKNGMAAGFWQGIARLFGTNLKKPYDPDGEDKPIEELVQKWENGEFEELYFSLFWKFPPEIEIPSKYR